jgi:hypothetical protein
MFQGFGNPGIQLPDFNTLPAIVILNTDPIYLPGEHWCVACFKKDKSCDFFDPYGVAPTAYAFGPVILDACHKGIRYNEKMVQGLLSKTCGHHCLFFALKYARGKKPEDIMQLYACNNAVKNDNMVFEYIKKVRGSTIATIIE